jgi:hypothetical protein
MSEHRHVIEGDCPVCSELMVLLAERYGVPVRSPIQHAAMTPWEVAQRLALLADLPHDEGEPA